MAYPALPNSRGSAVRPAGRAVPPGGGAGRRGFVVLFVAGLAVNVWALFPSPIESGVVMALPGVPEPAAAQPDPGIAGDLSDAKRDIRFRLIDAGLQPARLHPMTHRVGTYPSGSPGVAAIPVRAKLQALYLLLVARYGDDLDAMALEAKLQALLRLPDAVLLQLLQHPELSDLNRLLDGMFLAEPDLSGVKVELDKIGVISTSGPTERVDVVTVNGTPTYAVHSAVSAETTDEFQEVAALGLFAAPPAEFAVVTQFVAPFVAPAEVSIPAPMPIAETFVAAVESPPPLPTEPTVTPSTEPAEPSFVSPPPAEEPTFAPAEDTETADPPAPEEVFGSDDDDEGEDTSTVQHPVPAHNEPDDDDSGSGSPGLDSGGLNAGGSDTGGSEPTTGSDGADQGGGDSESAP